MMLRSFIAVEMPAAVQDAIAASTAGLRRTLPRPLVRWVAERNIHLTLKFLGEVSPANLELLAQALAAEAGQHAAFSLAVGGLGAFPSQRRPRVIWIGIEAPAALPALQRGIEAAAARLGYAPEARPFSQHLTIGRVDQNAPAAAIQQIRAALEQTRVGALGAVAVDAVQIFKSDLRPGGAVYTHLYSAPFGR
jgi:2'-5' RNA ligase